MSFEYRIPITAFSSGSLLALKAGMVSFLGCGQAVESTRERVRQPREPIDTTGCSLDTRLLLSACAPARNDGFELAAIGVIWIRGQTQTIKTHTPASPGGVEKPGT